MSWHPPIPAGKLYSEPALTLGPALAMLIWCYDGIQRDGTIEVSLERAAGETGKSYRTIKDWWRALRNGPFFSEMRDCGRKGWIVRMADEWLDWHTMERNYPQLEGRKAALEGGVSRTNEGQSIALEDAQAPLKARSRPGEGRKAALEGSAYKVLHADQESERESDQHDNADASLSLVKRQSGKEPLHPAVALYRNAWPDIRLTSKQEAIIRDVVGDRAEHLECWREVIRDYELSPQWKPENLGNMRERLDRKIADRANKANNGGAANGRPPPDNRPSLQPYQAQHARTDPAKFRTAVEEVRKKNGNTS